MVNGYSGRATVIDRMTLIQIGIPGGTDLLTFGSLILVIAAILAVRSLVTV